MSSILRHAAVALFAGAASPASAAITDQGISGSGVITVSTPAPDAGIFGPPVGTPVVVNVNLHFGTASGDAGLGYPSAPPDNYTGHFSVSEDMLFDHYSVFSWSVTPGDAATTLDQAFNSGSGEFDFVGGRVTSFTLFYSGDPDAHSLSSTSWSTNGRPFDDVYHFAGTWAANATPEPASWALMVVGFGLTGVAVRRRSALPAA